MKNAAPDTIRILAHLKAELKASRDLTGGVLHYAAIHPDVTVQLFGAGTAHPHHEDFHAWKPDGIIVSTNDDRTVDLIKSLGCGAALFVNAEAPAAAPFRCASVFCDNKAVAEAAARLFVDKGLKHFAFVQTLEREQWAEERSRTMRECASRLGCSFSAFDTPRTGQRDLRRELSLLAAWIATLPKPCGILAANDSRAKYVVDACREASVAIPEQVMVLGVDNEDFICPQLHPALSSIMPDFHQGGYLAAEMLVQLVAGGRRRLPRGVFGVRGIAERVSTSDGNDAGRMVGKADAFMRLNIGNCDISVRDVAKAAHVSLRLLQMNYKAVTGATISQALQSLRLEKVCELLRETLTPIGRIGELCGFTSETYLKNLFRARFGCSMRDWRKNRLGAARDGLIPSRGSPCPTCPRSSPRSPSRSRCT